MVFLKDLVLEDEEDVRQVRRSLEVNHGDRVRTEKGFNYVEVVHLFGTSPLLESWRESLDERDLHLWLAGLLRDMWGARLRSLYPERSFTVEVVDDTEQGGEIYVGFHQ